MSALARLAALLPPRRDPASLEALAAALGAIEPDELDLPRRLAGLGEAAWRGETLAEGPGWRLSLFLVPAGRTLPLHDHPGMRVLTRLLAGRLRVTAWEWADPAAALARRVLEVDVGPGRTCAVTGPQRRNLHQLEARSDAAFLDLFLPYYGPGRPCTYYRVAGRGADGIDVLEEV